MDGGSEQQNDASRMAHIPNDGSPAAGNRGDERGNQSGGSDNNAEGGSGEEVIEEQAGDSSFRKRKRPHRHTAEQICELENAFKECPHPDEKQRKELGERLNMQSSQVKFWFQNRRTHMKSQIEKHDNLLLRQENEKLRAETAALQGRVRNPVCTSCTGPDGLSEMQRLSMENGRLKEQVQRITALCIKFMSGYSFPGDELGMGDSGSVPGNPVPPDFQPLVNLAGPTMLPGNGAMQMPAGFGCLGGGTLAANGSSVGEVFVQLALAALNELVKVAQVSHPVWMPSLPGKPEMLNFEEYHRTFPRMLGPSPMGFVAEATKDVGIVIATALDLVEALMDAPRWSATFPGLIVRAATTDIITTGVNGTRDGWIQLMNAQLQVQSPMVPVCEVTFVRICRRQAEGQWAIVDVSIDGVLAPDGGAPAGTGLMGCRLLPSGCMIHDMNNGCCKITWVVHAEYDETVVPPLYQPLLRSGMAFGARRWLASLQRRCQYLDMLSNTFNPAPYHGMMSPMGRTSMLKLVDRMTGGYFAAMCASPAQNWRLLEGQPGQGEGEIVRMMARQTGRTPGEPPGLVMGATTTRWLPATPPPLVFDYLRDEKRRGEWDILANGDGMMEMEYVAKGQLQNNTVSMLRPKTPTGKQSNMLIVQETSTDPSGSLVIFAPVDLLSMNGVMNGATDPDYVCILPSGFSILPDGHASPTNTDAASSSNASAGSLLTVSFQILMSSAPAAPVTTDAVDTISKMITGTIKNIKAALGGNKP